MPRGAWIWLGLVYPVIGAVWALWPARFLVLLDLGPERQRVRLRVRLLGVYAALEGTRAWEKGEERGDPRMVAALRVHLRLLGFLRVEKRFQAPEEVAHGAKLADWIRSFWSDPPLGEGRSLADRLRARGRKLQHWSRLGRTLGRVLRRHLWVHRLDARFTLGSGDAALTGWLAAAVWSLCGVVGQGLYRGLRLAAPPSLRVKPVFHGRCLQLRLTGRMTIRQGWLGWMGALAAAGVLARRAKGEGGAGRGDPSQALPEQALQERGGKARTDAGDTAGAAGATG